MSSSEAIFLNTTIERAPAQSQRFSRMTDVAGVACEGFADEQRFYFLKAHLFDGAGALPLVAQSQVAWTDHFALGEQDGALNGMIQFAHIARPEILQHLLHGGRIEAVRLLAIAMRICFEEMLRQQRNVFTAITQRWQVNFDCVESE